MTRNGVELRPAVIEAFCRKWRIDELALFGSVLRPDFRADSDVDVLVTFQSGDRWDLWDIVAMKDELEAMLARPVDLVEKSALRNDLRRQEILAHNEVIYAA